MNSCNKLNQQRITNATYKGRDSSKKSWKVIGGQKDQMKMKINRKKGSLVSQESLK